MQQLPAVPRGGGQRSPPLSSLKQRPQAFHRHTSCPEPLITQLKQIFTFIRRPQVSPASTNRLPRLPKNHKTAVSWLAQTHFLACPATTDGTTGRWTALTAIYSHFSTAPGPAKLVPEAPTGNTVYSQWSLTGLAFHLHERVQAGSTDSLASAPGPAKLAPAAAVGDTVYRQWSPACLAFHLPDRVQAGGTDSEISPGYRCWTDQTRSTAVSWPAQTHSLSCPAAAGGTTGRWTALTAMYLDSIPLLDSPQSIHWRFQLLGALAYYRSSTCQTSSSGGNGRYRLPPVIAF